MSEFEKWLDQLAQWHRGGPWEGSPRYDQPPPPNGMLSRLPGAKLQQPIVTPQADPRWIPESERPQKRFDARSNRESYHQRLLQRQLEVQDLQESLRQLQEMQEQRTDPRWTRG